MNRIALSLVMTMLLSLGFSTKAEDMTSTIEWLSVYTEYGNGDVAFLTKDKGTKCFGYWISPNSPGFEQTYSALLSAYHADSIVQLTIAPAEEFRWPASSNYYCKVIRVALAKQ